MAKRSKVAPHMSAQGVMGKIKETVGFWRVQKWLVIYNLLVDPRPLNEIARHVGLALQTVKNLVSRYNHSGTEAIESTGKGGRRNAYMTIEEEATFLQPFFKIASTGQIATNTQIKRALEDRLGHKVHKTTVYRLLDRHGWRKIVPRPAHKEANEKEQEDFKKNFRRR